MSVPNFRPVAGVCWRPSFGSHWAPRGTADSVRFGDPRLAENSRLREDASLAAQLVPPKTEGTTSSGFTPNRVGGIMGACQRSPAVLPLVVPPSSRSRVNISLIE
jgi:hypothetical protein